MRKLVAFIVLLAVSALLTGVQGPTTTRADPGGAMYWTDRGPSRIQPVNLDGSGVADLSRTASSLDIVLDLTAPVVVAAAAGVVALASGGWYARRRWLRRQRDVRRVRERIDRWCLERHPLVRSASVDREGPA
jgi:hypothetical protein